MNSNVILHSKFTKCSLLIEIFKNESFQTQIFVISVLWQNIYVCILWESEFRTHKSQDTHRDPAHLCHLIFALRRSSPRYSPRYESKLKSQKPDSWMHSVFLDLTGFWAGTKWQEKIPLTPFGCPDSKDCSFGGWLEG